MPNVMDLIYLMYVCGLYGMVSYHSLFLFNRLIATHNFIGYGRDVTELDDYQGRNLMHADHFHANGALARVVVLEIVMLHLARVIHVDQADDFQLMDFDFALPMNLEFG